MKAAPRRVGFNIATGSWTKQAIRKLGTDENGDRKLAQTIATETLPGRPEEQQELAAWLLARPGRLRQVQRDREAAQRVASFELRGKALTMNRSEQLRAVVKSAGGIVSLAKRIVRDGTSDGITEHELTSLIVEHAKRAQPDLSDAQAFAKMFCDTSPAGETLRRAVNVAKQAGLLDASGPYQVGGDDATDVDDPQAALDQLKELIAELRSRARDLTESDAWNRVVVANPLLAKRAFQRPTMTSVYQFPRT
jgi:hypothetical protein